MKWLDRKRRGLALHARVALFLLVLPVLVKLLPLQRVVSVLTPRTLPARAPWSDVDRARWAVDNLYRVKPLSAYGPCLRRSLALYFLLTRLGYPVRVALGARVHKGAFLAHAWLIYEGAPLFEPPTVEQYATMTEWGGHANWTQAASAI